MSEDDGPQGTFMRREMITDSLSSIAPYVNVLEHLQKEMARVLKDPTMDTEEKLASYKYLMTRSQILTSKAKSTTTEPYTHPTPLHTHDDVDRDLSGDETQPEKRPIPVREKNKKKKSSKEVVSVHTLTTSEGNISNSPILQANSEETLQRTQHWKRLSRFTSLHKKRSYGPRR